MHVSMYPNPDSRPHPPQRSTTNCHRTKLTILQQQQAPSSSSSSSSSSRQNHARKVAHPGCTLWLVACMGAYDAAPRMDSRQSWGRERMYSMNHYLVVSPTPNDTDHDDRQPPPEKKKHVLLCCCSEQQYNSQPVKRTAVRTCLLAQPFACTTATHRRLCCRSSCAVSVLNRQARHNFNDVYSGPKSCGTAVGRPLQPLESTAVVVAV